MLWQTVKNTYHLVAAVCAVVLYRYPARRMTVIGVTGTDGKTTTATMIYYILRQAHKKAGLVSTVSAKIGDQTTTIGLHVTTPSPFLLQKLLRKMVDRGCDYAVIEATSHGLDQNRLVGCNFTIGVLTNITHEHLDYHQTFHNYVLAKAKLFKRTKYAILNSDGTWFDAVKSFVCGKIISYGLSQEALVNPKTMPLTLNILGNYNMANALGAAAVGRVLGISDDDIHDALASFSGVEGRLEKVNCGQPFQVIVDFAHTPNATEQVLATLRNETKGNLIAMFGSAGLRDKTKRPLTGAAVAAYANLAIVTADDPATEDVHKIIKQIIPGCEKAGALCLSLEDALARNYVTTKHYYIIEPDRRKAIRLAVRLAKQNDIVALLSKGHQKSFSQGRQEIPWSENQFAIDALHDLGYGKA